MGQVRQGPVPGLPVCWALLLPSRFSSLARGLWAAYPGFSSAKGGHPGVQRSSWSRAGIIPFPCQVLHVGICVWGGRGWSRAPCLPGSSCRAVPCPATLWLPCKEKCPARRWQRLGGSR